MTPARAAVLASAVFSLAAVSLLPRVQGDPPPVQEDAAVLAVSADPAVAAKAVAALRARGAEGLEALLSAHSAALTALDASGTSPTDEATRRLTAAVDAVAGQKDARFARLFWNTDLAAALSEASARGKPVLSLRLLGRLNEDCSCANSRFFRTALYANTEVSKALRERFVLHWQSVRPVPKVTIDFGDGRVVERTVTGNSIHYVLDAKGRPVDAIPGLYGPKAFLRALDAAEKAAVACAPMDDRARQEFLRAWHEGQGRLLEAAWAKDAKAAGLVATAPGSNAAAVPAETPAPGTPPTAAEAARLTVGKGLVEFGVVAAIAPARGPAASDATDAQWAKVAALHAEDARLDASSVALIRAKTPDAALATRLTMTKARVEDPLVRLVRGFERSIAEDTVRNEYGMHAKIHAWFADGSALTALDVLNERVYAQLFLTPSSDPWLGLVPPDAYSALDGGGLRGEK